MRGGDHYREQRMGCVRHPYEGSVGVCASCVSDRLSKDSSSSSERGRFAKSSTLSEEYFLWKEGASSSSSISKHGVTKGGRIVDTIASLIKTDYAIPTNYERPRSRPDRQREEHSSRSFCASAEQPKASESSLKGVSSTKEDTIEADFRTFSRITLAQSERDSKSRDICEITPEEEPEREPEPGQTIHALLDAEPKSGKFSRSTSKGSPASYFSRSGSRRQSWTVFWRSDKKECARTTTAGGGGGEGLMSVSDAHDRAASSRLVFNGVDTSDFRNRRHSESSLRSNHYPRRSSTRKTTAGEEEEADVSLSTRLSAEEGCKRLADSDYLDRKPRVLAAAAAASTHSFERNRSWEQLGLAKLPFASVYAAPTTGSNGVNGVGEQRRNRWKMVKKKSEKLEAKTTTTTTTTTTTGAGAAAGDRHSYPLTVIHQAQKQAQAHVASSFDEDGVGGQSSGKPTPCTSNCFPQSGGRHILRREDAHISHEKLRHRRLSIYSYGIMSQPQLTALDSQFSYTGRSRVARPYTYNGNRRESRESYYYPNGRIAVDYWDGDESMSPCDHYVEVSHRGGDGVSTGIIDFIPASEAQKKAYDWVERTKIEGNRSPPRWIERRGESMEDEDDLDLEDDSSISVSGDINFRGKEELTTVFEQDSESGYGEEYGVGAFDGQADDCQPHVYKDDQELDCTESPDSCSFPGVGDSRLAKGKSIVSEIEELEEEDDDDPRTEEQQQQQQQQHHDQQFDQNGGEALLSVRSLSDADSYARESTDSEILPTRNSLRSLFYMDGREAIDDVPGEGGEGEGRAYKPDNAYEEQDLGDWTPEPADSDHKDGQTNNNSSSIKRSPWKNITMSPSMRKKFLWPRSSPQPHLRRSFEVMGNSNGRNEMFSSVNGHHQTSLSFSDTDSHLARPRSPTSTNENTSSNLMLREGPEVPLPGGVLSDTLQDEITNGTSETVLSIVEIEESSLKSSPLRSSSSRASSPQRASLSRSSSKSPQITLSRCSSRRSRSSSWNSCLTDTAWSAQSAPTKKGENGSHQERQGALSTLIRLGKKLSRRSSPINISVNTSPWRGFSKASPQRGEATSA